MLVDTALCLLEDEVASSLEEVPLWLMADVGLDTLDLQVNSWPLVTPPCSLLTPSSQENWLLDVCTFNPPRTSTRLGKSTLSKLPVISTVPSTCCSLGTLTLDSCVLLAKDSAPPSICNWGTERFFSCKLLDTVNVPAICVILGKESDENELATKDKSPVICCTLFKPTSWAKSLKSPW